MGWGSGRAARQPSWGSRWQRLSHEAAVPFEEVSFLIPFSPPELARVWCLKNQLPPTENVSIGVGELRERETRDVRVEKEVISQLS